MDNFDEMETLLAGEDRSEFEVSTTGDVAGVRGKMFSAMKLKAPSKLTCESAEYVRICWRI